MSGPTSGGPKDGGVRRLVGQVAGYFRSPARIRRILIAILVSLPFTMLLYGESGGTLLYRIDFPGVYRPGGFFLSPSSNYLIPSFTSAITLGNVYAAQYLALFLDAFFCAYGAQLFVRELFRNTFDESQFLGVQALAAGLYLFNPFNVTWGYYSLTLDVFLNNAAFFVVMTMMVRLARNLLAGRTLDRWDALLFGIALGLSAPTSFPDLARTLFIEAMALLLLAVLGAIWVFSSRTDRAVALANLRRFALFTVPVAALLLAYPFYQFLTDWLFQPTAVSIVAAKDLILFRPNSFNTLGNVLRLLGRSNFVNFPYYRFYVADPWVILGSWLWPLLALFVPLLLSLRASSRDRLWIWLAIAACVPCIVWATGAQPPFGPVNTALQSALPFGREFMPSFFAVQLVLTKLYVALIAFSLGAIYLLLAQGLGTALGASSVPSPTSLPTPGASAGRPWLRRGSPRSPAHRVMAVGTVAVLVGLLLVASLPIFNGGLFELPHQRTAGFRIPNDYFTARAALNTARGNAILLPALHLYVGTTWGYVGVTGFFTQFNYPSQVVCPAYYGPYKFLLPATREDYARATEPIGPGPNVVPVNLSSNGTFRTGARADIEVVPFGASLNLSGFQWLQVTIPTSNPGLWSELLANDSVQFGLRSSRQSIGWYQPENAAVTQVKAISNGSINVSLLLGGPSHGTVDPAQVRALLLDFTRPEYPSLLGLSRATLAGVPGSVVYPGWVSFVEARYHAHYILLDRTIMHGTGEPVAYAEESVATLQSEGLARPVVVTGDVELWELA